MPTQKPRLTITFDEWLDKEIEKAAKQGGYKSKSSYIVAIICRELCPDRLHEIGGYGGKRKGAGQKKTKVKGDGDAK